MIPGDPPSSLAERVQSLDPQELLSVATDLALSEDIALALLKRRDLPADVIEAIAKNPSVVKQRKVSFAVASHPRAPRHVSLPLIRHLYTFELVKIASLPTVPSDVKIAVEQTILARLEQISEGERLTLAKQASGRVAGALLLVPQERVNQAALQNPRMTEAIVIKALGNAKIPPTAVLLVCNHPQWSLRREIRLALLRNPHTPLAHALRFIEGFPEHLVREVLTQSDLRPEIKTYLLATLKSTDGSDPIS